MENTLHFLGGMGFGVILVMLITSFNLDSSPDAPPGAIVITRADGVQCVGHIAAPPAYVGVPPRLWICGDELPWYDASGTQIPTRPLGEIP